ncbi:hypothetical protein HZB94_02000 [Candidatus Falkowbacteria bacterium]|nr:hypothetical protein [Candidatus Falkowbacteria bacterium]
MSGTSTLAKKKKAEILEEYSKLKEKLEDASGLAQQVYKQQNLDIIAKAKEQDTNAIAKVFSALKQTMNAEVNGLLEQLNVELTKLMQKTLAGAKEFDDLQNGVEISKQTLEANYNIQIGAETLANLIDEYTKKQKDLEDAFQIEKDELEMKIALRKRDWEREQEELAYSTKLQREREQAQFETARTEQEQTLAARENTLNQREGDLKRLQDVVTKMPENIQKEVEKKEGEILKNLQIKFAQDLKNAQQTWTAEKNIYELRIENLQTQLEKQQITISEIKIEADKAAKKAQELAITIIEGKAKEIEQTSQKAEAKYSE